MGNQQLDEGALWVPAWRLLIAPFHVAQTFRECSGSCPVASIDKLKVKTGSLHFFMLSRFYATVRLS